MSSMEQGGDMRTEELREVIGDIKKSKGTKYLWAACKNCRRERWVVLLRTKKSNYTGLCQQCEKQTRQGENHSQWKGGKWKTPLGYILVWIDKSDFFYSMAQKSGYVLEHRLVVAKALNRCLLPWELVHHKGVKYPQSSKENRSDNRYPENLELLTEKRHMPSVQLNKYIKQKTDEAYQQGRQDMKRELKDAGLAFVVKDAELPQLGEDRLQRIANYKGVTTTGFISSSYYMAQEDMLKARFRQTEEIE